MYKRVFGLYWETSLQSFQSNLAIHALDLVWLTRPSPVHLCVSTMAERRPSAATGASMNATGFTPGSSAAGDGGVAHQRRQHGSTASISNQPFITAPRMSYSAPSGPTSQFAAPTRAAGQDGSAATTVKNVANKIEEMMDTYSHPIKPYLPAIGRFLIVSTFLEDAWR